MDKLAWQIEGALSGYMPQRDSFRELDRKPCREYSPNFVVSQIRKEMSISQSFFRSAKVTND